MKRIFTLVLILHMAVCLNAQTLYQSARGADMLKANGDTLFNAWTGGLSLPQFSNIDLDQDGRLDLFIFETQDGKALTFINTGGNNYRYAPEYEKFFPEMEYWALLLDYNKDGKPDIFTYSREGGAMDVYKNVSTGPELKFKLEATAVDYHEPTYDMNLYISNIDIPAFTDMDGDGDIDVFSYDVSGTIIYQYRNNSMELYGVPDSLDFSVVEYCWCKFRESSQDNGISLGQKCLKVQKRKHAGSTMLVFDADNDGDQDLLMGDVSFDNLIFLENGRIRSGFPDWERDSAVSVSNAYPPSHPAKVKTYPAPFMVDADGDDVMDLLVSPQGRDESISKDHILFYHNSGTNESPAFDFVQSDFLAGTTFGNGRHAAPAFWDYNKDGLMDLAIGVKANDATQYIYSKIVLYENIGSSSHPVFRESDSDFAQLSLRQERYYAPAFGDLDGDGKTDMLVGMESGKILYLRNKGLSNGIPEMEFVSDNYAGIQLDLMSRPFLADIDKDGLLDLVTGDRDGAFSYYHNDGSKTNPLHKLVTNNFGHARVNEFYYQYEYDSQGKPKDSTLNMYYIGNSSPVITDLDHDGKLDLISGSWQGKLFFYMNIEDSLTGTFSARTDIIYNPLSQSTDDKDFGLMTVPAAATLDNDVYPDLLVGNYRGGMYYLGSMEVPIWTDTELPLRNTRLRLFPNPAKGHFRFSVVNGDPVPADMHILDMTGRVVLNRRFDNLNQLNDVDAGSLNQGVYIVQLISGRESLTERLIIR